ncbi:MAG: biotin/lipoyl-containing protein, partial [Solirubrobacteraceae bacterium]
MVAETATQVVMPQMGDSVSEGTILEWRKSEGDHVSAEETLLEISTDKVDAEVAAPVAGTVIKIHAAAGDTVAVGALLAEIAPGGGASPPAAKPVASTEGSNGAARSGPGSGNGASAPGAPPAAPTTIDIVTPAAGESVTEGTILDWSVKVGERVAAGDTVVEISTDKVDVELPAPAAGTITELLAAPGETVTVGQVIGRMTSTAGADESSAGAPPPSAEPAPATSANADGTAVSEEAKASPVARRAAATLHVDLGSVAGSGRDGRIVKEDVLAAAEHPGASEQATPASSSSELRGGAAMLVRYMEESRTIPTATSLRTIV